VDAERFVLVHSLGGVNASAVYAEPEGTSGAASGKRLDGVSRRPARDAMMADALAGKIGACVTMTPDRGSREVFRGGVGPAGGAVRSCVSSLRNSSPGGGAGVGRPLRGPCSQGCPEGKFLEEDAAGCGYRTAEGPTHPRAPARTT